jgi:hypothetical protein
VYEEDNKELLIAIVPLKPFDNAPRYGDSILPLVGTGFSTDVKVGDRFCFAYCQHLTHLGITHTRAGKKRRTWG